MSQDRPTEDEEARARNTGPSFAFTDKRKVDSSGQPRKSGASESKPPPTAPPVPPATAQPVPPAAAQPVDALDAPLDGASPVEVEPDPHEVLAAERLADLQRLQAEYANYRKRVARDRDVASEAAISSVVDALLPVLDDIHLARQHGDLESGPFASIAEKLEGALSKFGVERFGEPGTPFDPEVHDALMHVEEELAEGTDVTTVVGVLQPGYKIGEKIIRPARVSVADPQ